MAITLGKNIGALTIQSKLTEQSNAMAKSFERLSSGLRINGAVDDPAGLALSNSLLTDSRLYAKALGNINDGISALNIADQAIAGLEAITDRLSELSAQAANGVYSSTQREALDAEAQQLVSEYSRIISTTTFNGTPLLDGSAQLTLQVGTDSSAASRINVGVGNVSSTVRGLGTFGAGTFSATTTQRLVGVTTADFNGDTIEDILGTSDNGAGTQVFLGNGDGTFKTGSSLGVGGSAVSAGDFNNDGAIDVLYESSSNDVEIRLGNGNGTFKAALAFDVGTNLQSVSVRELNGDNFDDVVVLDTTTGTLSVLISNGNGTFSGPGVYTSAASQGAHNLTDADGDGNLDLIVGFSGGLLVLHGNGNGSFRAPSTVTSATTYGVHASADFNSDGLIDLLLVDNNSNMVTLLGNGNGTFKSKTVVGTNYQRGVASDLNGDGAIDFVMGQSSGLAQGLISFGNGDGTFRVGTTFALPSSHIFQAMALGDANNDGAPDLFAASFTGNSIDVLLQDTEITAGLPAIDLSTVVGARAALDAVALTRSQLLQARATVGANLSRLSVAAELARANQLNAARAYSVISDADIAQESANLARLSILTQVSTALLAHAKSQPEIALTLLDSMG